MKKLLVILAVFATAVQAGPVRVVHRGTAMAADQDKAGEPFAQTKVFKKAPCDLDPFAKGDAGAPGHPLVPCKNRLRTRTSWCRVGSTGKAGPEQVEAIGEAGGFNEGKTGDG